ncbi:MAG TPA: hypothetical protein VER33_11500 [Polyangiaceae bacterium]|nr:hypothetical protein [Polyangiaceae bacterium]
MHPNALPNWAGIFACPSCGRELVSGPNELDCGGCKQAYPLLGSVPCLVPDPALWRALWSSRLDDYLEVTASRIRHMRGETELPGLLPRTRARLQRIIEAKERERTIIPELLAPLRPATLDASVPHAPSRPEALAGRLAVLEWYEHIFRDWAWGGAENARLAALVQSFVPRPLELLAVYGAGAGRLAFDVHRGLAPRRTVALDLNPLPLLVAERMLQGDALELYEFPVAPTTDEHMVVLQRLSAPEKADSNGLCFAFGDGLKPPFAPGSLDAVLTPWFVDAIGVDLRVTAALINRALKPGGLWLQVGPLNFNLQLSQTYLREELADIVQSSGFELLSERRERVPYFDSPVSGSWRQETVYCFAAEKRQEAPVPTLARASAPWVDNPRVPIAPSGDLMNLGRTSAFTALVLSLVDGQRSIIDVAHAVAPHVGMDPGMLEHELRAFFGKLPAS